MPKKRTVINILFIVLTVAMMTACSGKDVKPEQKVYIAWSNNQESYSFISTLRTVEAAGAKPVVLEQALSYDLHYDGNGELTDAEKDEHRILTSEEAKKVKDNTWQNSNVEEIMKGVDCVIFPGGSDICPTLYHDEQDWHGIEGDTDYSAERDVSDYILLSYCLEKDIPVLAICRGMQMLSIVCGADMIQDIGQWYEAQGIEYSNDHRDAKKERFVAHSVSVTSKGSHLYRIMGRETISKVPSWHHQAVENIGNTKLVMTAQTETDGKRIIEGVERPDKEFCVGVQFHPEVAVRKHLEKEEDAESFMDYDTALSLFKALIDASQGSVSSFKYELADAHSVAGRQGVCTEKGYYWVSGSATLAKYDSSWNLIAENTDPFEGYTLEVNHIGDIDVYNNELYLGVEHFADGEGKNIQVAVYDGDTLKLKRVFPFSPDTGQLECSGIAVDSDSRTVYMTSWIDDESSEYLYMYDLDSGDYKGKLKMDPSPKWIQGIACFNGSLYVTSDDGDADNDESDHMYRIDLSDSKDVGIVALEKAFDDVIKQGEIEGLTFDKDRKQLLLLYNRGAKIDAGMPVGFYEGYSEEIHEVFAYNIVEDR